MPEVTPNPKRRHAVRTGAILLSGAAGLTLIGVMLATGFMGPQPTAPSSSQAQATADTALAAVIAFDVTATASGELEARHQIEIRNQLEQPTAIVDIVTEGSFVKKDDVLVRLNSDAIQTNIEEELLRVETARAELAVAENTYAIQVNENDSALRKAKLNVDLAELDLRKWLEGEVVSTRQANDLALEKAKRELTRLKEKFDQSVQLEARGFLSRDELKRDELSYLEADAALKNAELAQKVFEEFQLPKDRRTRESAVEEAKAELERTLRKNDSELSSREADRNNKRQQLSIRESRLAKAREQLESSTIKAPSDGLVVHATSLDRMRWGGSDRGTMETGRQVQRNELLLVLPDTSEMVAAVRVHESIAGRVKVDQPATIKIDALGGKSLRGTVISIGVLAESGGWRDPNLREYTVKIKLEDTTGLALRPSMRCEAEINLDRVENALAVPVQSIFSDGLIRFVYVPSGKNFDRRAVKVGRRSDRFAEILVGVQDGERVLVRTPEPGEIVDRPWNNTDLAPVGLTLSKEGKIVPLPPAPGGAPVAGAAMAPRPG